MNPLEEARDELAREKTRLENVCCQRDALMDAISNALGDFGLETSPYIARYLRRQLSKVEREMKAQ